MAGLDNTGAAGYNGPVNALGWMSLPFCCHHGTVFQRNRHLESRPGIATRFSFS